MTNTAPILELVGALPTLRRSASTNAATSAAGLYNAAHLPPGRAELDAWLAHAMTNRSVTSGAQRRSGAEALERVVDLW